MPCPSSFRDSHNYRIDTTPPARSEQRNEQPRGGGAPQPLLRTRRRPAYSEYIPLSLVCIVPMGELRAERCVLCAENGTMDEGRHGRPHSPVQHSALSTRYSTSTIASISTVIPFGS